MENSSTSKIEGTGKVVLKMTMGKFLTLKDVLHVLEIQKNLVSGSLSSKNVLKLVFESDKLSLFKSGMYVGKGYLSNGLFKMNVMTVIDNNKGASSVYMLESSNVWHGRLGHVNYYILDRLINLNFLNLKLILIISVKFVWKLRWQEHLLNQLKEALNL